MSCLRIVFLSILFIALSSAQAHTNIDDFEFLEFNEIQGLSKNIEPEPHLVRRLGQTLNTVFYRLNDNLHNNNLQYDRKLDRKFFRVTQWNISGINDPDLIQSQIRLLKKSDIFILNSVDWGMPASSYKNIAEEFSDAVGGEYIFAAEFLNLDPKLLNYAYHSFGHNPYLADVTRKANNFKLGASIEVSDYKGLQGNAIVSKFPIKSTRIVRLPACYDWFEEEAKFLQANPKERTRKLAKNRLGEGVINDIRRGGRVALIADIILPNQTEVTVISTQLENRTTPKCREEQMHTILNAIKDVKQPIILGADLNCFEKNAAPTTIGKSVKDTVTDPQNLAKKVVNYFNPFALPTNIFSFTAGGYRKKKNPTVSNVPIILRNKSAGLFKTIQKFEFSDASKFDFSGTDELSFDGEGKLLSNSNQRGGKGFVETYRFKKTLGTGKYKSDWIFVKSKGTNYIPAFAQTLSETESSPLPLYSHNPISVKILI